MNNNRGTMNDGADDANMRDDGLVPAGIQMVRAINGSEVWGQANTGTDQVGIQFRITKGPYKDRTLNWYGALTEKAKDRTIEQLKLAGARMKDGDITDLDGIGSSEFEAQVELSEHPTTGEPQSRISWLGTGVAMKNVHDDAAKAAIAKKFKGDVTRVTKKNGGAAATK